MSGENNCNWNPDRESIRRNDKIYEVFYRLKKYINAENYEEYEEIMGESLDLMLEHLESFKEKSGLDWKDYNNHIDHKWPRCAFAKYGITDPKIINSRDNLQVLTEHDNSSKGGKYDPIEFENYLIEHDIEFTSKLLNCSIIEF
jgi:hypothetical protein